VAATPAAGGRVYGLRERDGRREPLPGIRTGAGAAPMAEAIFTVAPGDAPFRAVLVQAQPLAALDFAADGKALATALGTLAAALAAIRPSWEAASAAEFDVVPGTPLFDALQAVERAARPATGTAPGPLVAEGQPVAVAALARAGVAVLEARPDRWRVRVVDRPRLAAVAPEAEGALPPALASLPQALEVETRLEEFAVEPDEAGLWVDGNVGALWLPRFEDAVLVAYSSLYVRPLLEGAWRREGTARNASTWGWDLLRPLTLDLGVATGTLNGTPDPRIGNELALTAGVGLDFGHGFRLSVGTFLYHHDRRDAWHSTIYFGASIAFVSPWLRRPTGEGASGSGP
jgi:hypothetical protein